MNPAAKSINAANVCTITVKAVSYLPVFLKLILKKHMIVR
jgi:hypothetical protein